MKLSICIPVYNTDMNPLVEELLPQVQSSEEEVELFLLDDGSSQPFKNCNAQLADKCRYEELPENVGRSAIRNTLAARAKGEYILFLDGDVRMVRQDFVARYIAKITFQHEPTVYVGGRVYGPKPKASEYLLRWLYGVHRESKAAASRQTNPYENFMTNNFLVPASLFNQLQFDESLQGYGHEDTWFGLGLKELNFPILHIENPVLNGELDSADQFLNHTKEALTNLDVLVKKEEQKEKLEAIKAIQVLRSMAPFLPIVKGMLTVLKPWWSRNLKGSCPSLKAFDAYRLYWAIKIIGKI